MPYTDEERGTLVEILTESALSPEGTGSPSNQLKPPERAVYELEAAAQDCINKFEELRDGVLDERLETVRTLEKLHNAAHVIFIALQEPTVRDALTEYGSSLPHDADNVTVRLLRACEFSSKGWSQTPGGIKSEGRDSSSSRASC